MKHHLWTLCCAHDDGLSEVQTNWRANWLFNVFLSVKTDSEGYTWSSSSLTSVHVLTAFGEIVIKLNSWILLIWITQHRYQADSLTHNSVSELSVPGSKLSDDSGTIFFQRRLSPCFMTYISSPTWPSPLTLTVLFFRPSRRFKDETQIIYG